MSYLGIDIGTTGCKAVLFSDRGAPLSFAYDEYDIDHPRPGWSELDPNIVWSRVKRAIAKAAAGAGSKADPVRALAVSSMGESMVPVSRDRRILGPSLLLIDSRGEEYLPRLASSVGVERLYEINGNILGTQYSLPKLMWIRDNTPEVYSKAWKFLLWSGFVAFMLGAEARVDYSLANRTLLFDIEGRRWSGEVAAAAGIDLGKLPDPVPGGSRIGGVSREMAEELGLPEGTPIIAGTHDQCANAVGCGVTDAGYGMSGMGTYLTFVPVFRERKSASTMIRLGLNTEHHASNDRFVSFIYNQGGLLLKWFRDTFARAEKGSCEKSGADIYELLIREVPKDPSSVVVLPHFTATGPPEFIGDSSGVIVGLKLDTSRGDILKGVMEGAVFYHKGVMDSIAEVGIEMKELRAVGGGSRSDAWLQICADILGKPMVRARVSEAGCLGAAIIAATGIGDFASLGQGVDAMVELGERFEPDAGRQRAYAESYGRYRALWPLMKDYLQSGPRG